MKKLLFLLMLIGVLFLTVPAAKAYTVNGYFRSSGTYVSPYTRSLPNAYRYDNYGYRSYQPLYNSSYYTPTRNYSSSWYTPYRSSYFRY